MCVSVAGGGSRPVRSSSSNQEQERRVQQQQQEPGDSQCVGVERRRSSSSSSVDCGSRRGRRALGSGQAPTAAGMAPALTQATPHQRSCCAPNPHSVTLAQPSNHKHQHHLPTVEDKQSVWPASSHCCGGGGGSVGGGGNGVNGNSNVNGGNGAVKPTRRNAKHSNNSSGGSGIKAIGKINNTNGNSSSSCTNKKEIARSDHAEAKSRTGAGGRGLVATAAVVDGQSSSSQLQQQMRSLSAPTAPPTSSADSGVNSSKAAIAPRSSPNGGGVVTNGTKTMGLQPATAPGDRMELLDSSPPPITDVPTSTSETTTASAIVTPAKKPPTPPTTDTSTTTPIQCWTATDDAEQADSITRMTECPDVEEATVDEIFNVLENMEAENGMAGLTAAEQQLLHAAAVAVLGEDGVVLSTSGVATTATCPSSLPVVSVVDKEAEVERRLCEARTKQQQIEQRCQTLLRRAGRLQSRHVSRHVADQVANFVVYARETLSLGTSGGGRGSHTGAGGVNLYGWAEDGRLPTREEVRNIPTATLVNLVSRLQAPPVSYLSNRRYFGLSSRSANQGGGSGGSQQQQQQQHPLHAHHMQQQHQQKSAQKLSTNVAETLEEVAGLWEAQLRYLQRHDDPDATESSSGGESDDDMPVPPQAPVNLYTPTAATTITTPTVAGSSSFTNASSCSTLADPQQLQSSELVLPTPAVEAPVSAATAVPTVKPVPTYQRAAWRWARDRAAVAARWSWLQAQVSDLEYRIRQHTDVYRQLRQAKGALHFVGANGLTGTTSGNGILNAISNNPTTPAASSAVKESNNSEHDEAIDGENCSSSSRTRPLVTGNAANANGKFRHRRLIRASQVTAGGGRKPSRPHSSTVRCCCVMSRICHPCVLCNGKNNYLLPVDPDGMTLRERIGLVDRGFHPVLSLPQDVPLSAHVDSLLKSGDWRPPPPSVNTPAPATVTTTSASTTSTRVRRSNSKQDDDGVGGGKRRPVKRKKPVDADEAGAKIERRKALLKRRKRATLSSEAMDDECGSFPSSPYADGSGAGSVPSTPGRSSMGSNQQRGLHQDLLRRRTSYDIDNIVIPYSMAATTRVERLQYKEIQTPKWRTVGEEDDASGKSEEEEVEDVSEEACTARHERSEQEERRKFMTYLKQPAGLTRGRRRVDHMAADSRTEHSSGANTPDPVPMSPGPDNSSTPLASAAVGPAALPIKVPVAVDVSSSVMEVDDDAADTSSTATEHFPALAIKERRRTASLTKKDAVWKFIQDDNSGMSWDLEEHYRPVVPYEPRQFPLPDSVYDELVAEMPPDETEEEQQLNLQSSSVKREMRTSECSAGGVPTPSTPVLLTPSDGQQQQSAVIVTSGTLLGEQSRAATPATFLSESIGSPGPDEDLDIDEDDPNDPEWEGSEGSAPKSGVGSRKK